MEHSDQIESRSRVRTISSPRPCGRSGQSEESLERSGLLFCFASRKQNDKKSFALKQCQASEKSREPSLLPVLAAKLRSPVTKKTTFGPGRDELGGGLKLTNDPLPSRIRAANPYGPPSMRCRARKGPHSTYVGFRLDQSPHVAGLVPLSGPPRSSGPSATGRQLSRHIPEARAAALVAVLSSPRRLPPVPAPEQNRRDGLDELSQFRGLYLGT